MPEAVTTPIGTGNYYSVWPGCYWNKFARPGEREVCDACMWADPAYQAEYGACGCEAIGSRSS